jgi:hypothetical protein
LGAPLFKSPALVKLHAKRTGKGIKAEETVKTLTGEDDSENEDVACDTDDEVPHATTEIVPEIKLEPEDELIIRMKEARYPDRIVARHLAELTSMRTQSKEIRSRWTRLRKALSEHNDELLNAELTVWHDGDDDVLQRAIAAADRDVKDAIEKARARKWLRVADHMKLLKPVTNFSPAACQNRAVSLQNGISQTTPESVQDPDQKVLAQIQLRKERQERIDADRMMKPIIFKPEQQLGPDDEFD